MHKNTKYACIFNKYAQNFTKYAQNGAFTNGTPYRNTLNSIMFVKLCKYMYCNRKSLFYTIVFDGCHCLREKYIPCKFVMQK